LAGKIYMILPMPVIAARLALIFYFFAYDVCEHIILCTILRMALSMPRKIGL